MLISRGTALTLLSAALALASAPAWAATMVEICHFPPGNPENFHTIRVSESALPAHLAHGDVGAACDTECEVPCDDFDACTIDGCLPGGICAPPEPVDCDDGDLCTMDSCEPTLGCIYECVDCLPPDACTVSSCAPDSGQCVDTPVVCPDGSACDPTNGCPPPVKCFAEPTGLVLDGADYAGSGQDSAAQDACQVELEAQGLCGSAEADSACSTAINGVCLFCLFEGTADACDACKADLQLGVDQGCSPGGELMLQECAPLPIEPADCPCLQDPASPESVEALIAEAAAVAAEVESLPGTCAEAGFFATYGRSTFMMGIVEGWAVFASGFDGCALFRQLGDPMDYSVEVNELVPVDVLACRDMVLAVQAADPFGVCVP